jgi:hypothetical protein
METHRNHKRLLLSLLLSLAAVLGTTVMTAAPASASTTSKTAVPVSSAPPTGTPCDNIYRDTVVIGKACFAHYGDKIWIRDLKADGAGIWAHSMTYEDDNVFRCYNDGGADVDWQVCDFEMVENSMLVLQGWARKDGKDWGWGKSILVNTSGY